MKAQRICGSFLSNEEWNENDRMKKKSDEKTIPNDFAECALILISI